MRLNVIPLTLAAVLLTGLAARAAVDRPKGHLFVAVPTGVERFPIYDGVPKSKPDRIYPGSAPIAVDADENLWSTTYVEYSEPSYNAEWYAAQLSMYTPHAQKPQVSFPVESDQWSVLAQLAVDPLRNLYVASSLAPWEYQQLYYIPYLFATSPAGKWYGNGITPASYGYYAQGMAVDKAGDMLASIGNGPPGFVVRYSSPLSNPELVGTLTGSGIVDPFALAVDASDELYVVNSWGPSFFIAAYPATASGDPSPDRVITIKNAQSLGGIDTEAGRLFVADQMGNAVYEVYSGKNGMQRPLWKLSIASPLDVKLGP